MIITPTPIADLLVLAPQVFEDERGFFYETFNANFFKKNGLNYHFVQDNQAWSNYGVLRGLHFQEGAFAQAKLVRVVAGCVFDVAVDLRPNSPTYHQWFGIELSAKNRKQLLIPRGFAHGYVALTAAAEFYYKCDNFYHKASEAGIRYNCPKLNINWPVEEQGLIISEKDLALPFLT
ncbi:MAG: dTDP-4-dehydrorhamnose 3,5-epimerase [Sphingobacteriales bacterium]|jgi:dTDP-4-dehydrorhamnose 3,5-epimerase|nr:dTDP-4-dehydrorhamnose 3,5-epimerase [Sphingobacteriales bacterium]MDA0200024.1 dTDP-4-dehydrorhamnose 3,5-epimerase [Bacteroidota bacterium]MBK6891156.1 dTDP-4-dehydrorhamnose 3,5-epimerase [Sphingobacteriales bacterium]MBK7527018.1 dTDP-4-dehydrorhamnose 3,5-epimerase [Sphingobacteriales bacterium]MBK8677508.1 dTDP-4-dehydrorhamnose 3,5-epimerase [Sphingobacteriales bacterium]